MSFSSDTNQILSFPPLLSNNNISNDMMVSYLDEIITLCDLFETASMLVNMRDDKKFQYYKSIINCSIDFCDGLYYVNCGKKLSLGSQEFNEYMEQASNSYKSGAIYADIVSNMCESQSKNKNILFSQNVKTEFMKASDAFNNAFNKAISNIINCKDYEELIKMVDSVNITFHTFFNVSLEQAYLDISIFISKTKTK